ncbi:hypothetical protein GJ496_011532 [Pomphorhynchus laevis]|nr:hypothetical protein GJ496_011532 [Pomphorhynchus laevis]
MGTFSSKNKEHVPVQLADGGIMCINRTAPNKQVNKSNCYPSDQVYCSPTYSHQHNPNVQHSYAKSNSYLTNTGYQPMDNRSMHMQPSITKYPTPLYPIMHNQQSNLLSSNLLSIPDIDLNKIDSLFKEFMSITNNQSTMDFNTFRILFMVALYRADFNKVNEMALSTFKRFDMNHDGVIDFNEFVHGYQMLVDTGNTYTKYANLNKANSYTESSNFQNSQPFPKKQLPEQF